MQRKIAGAVKVLLQAPCAGKERWGLKAMAQMVAATAAALLVVTPDPRLTLSRWSVSESTCGGFS